MKRFLIVKELSWTLKFIRDDTGVTEPNEGNPRARGAAKAFAYIEFSIENPDILDTITERYNRQAVIMVRKELETQMGQQNPLKYQHNRITMTLKRKQS